MWPVFDTLTEPKSVSFFGGGRVNPKRLESMSECKDSHFICPSDAFTCLPVFLRCNGVFDCPLHEDEAACDSYTCPGFYRCRGSRVCVHPDHVCDGVPHCPQRDDELLCHLTCPDECVCHGWAFVCKDVIRAPTFSQLRYLDVSGTGMTPQLLLHNRMLIHLSLAACHLEHLENLTLPNPRSLDSENQLTSVCGDHFSGVPLLYVTFTFWPETRWCQRFRRGP